MAYSKSGVLDIIAGVAAIALGVLGEVGTLGLSTPVSTMLIASGAGMLLSGVGTLIAGDQLPGFATATRVSKAPWKICYGRCRTGGTLVYQNTWGNSNEMLDMVFVLAAHPCESVDEVLFDQQRVQIDSAGVPTLSGTPPLAGSGTSFNPLQQTVNITSISRDVHGVVTVTLSQNIPYLTAGDMIKLQGVSSSTTNGFVGTFQVAEIISQTSGSVVFTFLSGGPAVTVSSSGQVVTLWNSYGRDVYCEVLLGNQTLGETFVGMIAGTPWQGAASPPGSWVSPQAPSGTLGLASGAGASGNGYTPAPNPWVRDCSLVGKTAVFLRLKHSTNFNQGIPNISFHLHGKNDIYDPRTGTRGYTENAALCIADYLTNTVFGFKAQAAWTTPAGNDIPTAPLIAAANTCDETVSLIHGTEPRWACNGQFDLTTKRGEVLQNLLTSCAGRLVYSGGQFFIQPAPGPTDYAPITAGVNLQSIATGPMKWRPTGSIDHLYNAVKGVYISPDNKWQATDFPPYMQDWDHGYDPSHLLTAYNGDANLKADGGDRRWLDISLPFTISAQTAQRIAKIELLRRRHQGTGTFQCNMSAYEYVPMDVIEATVPYFGWTNKQLEVAAVRLRADKTTTDSGLEAVVLSTELDVQETDSSVYQWATTEELTPQGYVQATLPTNQNDDTIAYPWSPGWVSPLVGDAIGGTASFGVEPVYSVDAQGNTTASLQIKGTAPINVVNTTIDAPMITGTAFDTGGNLVGGTYVVALSSRDSGGTPYGNTNYLDFVTASISSGVTTGAITIDISWGSGDDGGDLYIAPWQPNDGYVFHRVPAVSGISTDPSVPPGSASFTIVTYDQSQPGGVDPIFDHFGIVYQQEIHSGPMAAQVPNPASTYVTTNTVTLAADGMTTNQWQGYTLSLLAKQSSSVEVPILNMPIASSTASSGGFFTLTIGPNGAGDQLPDLTTLLATGDLLTIRFNATFTSTSFSDPNTANSLYPTGATGVEAGHLAVVLSGADIGDVRTISSVAADGSGNFTIFNLATPWRITPTTGDLVVICAPSTSAEITTAPVTNNNNLLSGVIATPPVQNLANSVWLFKVRCEDVNGTHCDDALAPFRELYLFGSGITRTITQSSTQLITDGRVYVDTTAGDLTYTLLPQATAYSQALYIAKISTDTNTATIQCATGDTFLDGTTGYVLTNQGDSIYLQF